MAQNYRIVDIIRMPQDQFNGQPVNFSGMVAGYKEISAPTNAKLLDNLGVNVISQLTSGSLLEVPLPDQNWQADLDSGQMIFYIAVMND